MEFRDVRASDIDGLLRLCDLAGWNQTAVDIGRLLALEPLGCFAACEGGRLVGTTTTTTYGTDLAWVGMVLVDPDYRRRGIATRLMEKALDYLRGRGVRTVKLDATPAGRPVYERLGFVAENPLERWAATGPPPVHHRRGYPVGSWSQIAATDRDVFGADRTALMQMIIADAGPPLVRSGCRVGIGGYAFARPGRRAGYIGPVVAEDTGTAWSLLTAVDADLRPAIIDIDPAFDGATDLLRERGFAQQREFVRMRLGPAIRSAESPRVFAIAGPEVG
ncbi:MAG TPA: GNAT family N-acetyltransferase [Gemmataceae bacterium]|nr:GNAT family N-acetyltransferase [Gemmataceae bacterium]